MVGSLSILAWVLLDIFSIDVLTLKEEVDSGLPAWQLSWEFNNRDLHMLALLRWLRSLDCVW